MGSLTSPKKPAVSPSQTSAGAQTLEALRRIVQALRETAAAAQRESGISGAQLFVLQQLEGGPLTINQLAERTQTHQSSVSAVALRLEQAGLVLRRAVAIDRRRIALHLTLRGRALAKKSPRLAQAKLIEALARMPESARGALMRGLTRLADEMGLAERAPMFFEEKPRPAAPSAAVKKISRRSRG